MTEESMEIVGAVDIAPEMMGKDLGRVLLLEKDKPLEMLQRFSKKTGET